MESVPNFDCDCLSLSEPLTQDDPLPDHVCQQTMMASVASAAREGVILPEPEVWPVRIGDRRLGLVIRQWAEEESSATLANLLQASPARQQTLQSMAFYFRLWRDRHPYAEVADWIWGSVCRAKLASELDRNRLLATPATMRHLRAVLAGVSEPLPARGVLITTKVYVQFHPTPGILHDPSPDFSVSGATEYVTGPLLAQAQQLILRHRDWLRGFGQHPMSKRHSIRRTQVGSFAQQRDDEPRDPSWYEYLAEALKGVDNLRKRVRAHPNGIECALSEYIEQIYLRVRERRKRADMPSNCSLDAGWRDEARRQLRDLL